MKELLTGNEAFARGVIDAGVHFASAYPGTPSSEILKNIALDDRLVAEWAPNEKVAMESAIGASIAGGRAFASMKHVGLNVAADPFMTYAYMGVLAALSSFLQTTRDNIPRRMSRTTVTLPSLVRWPCWNRQIAKSAMTWCARPMSYLKN